MGLGALWAWVSGFLEGFNLHVLDASLGPYLGSLTGLQDLFSLVAFNILFRIR